MSGSVRLATLGVGQKQLVREDLHEELACAMWAPWQQMRNVSARGRLTLGATYVEGKRATMMYFRNKAILVDLVQVRHIVCSKHQIAGNLRR